MVLYQSNLSLPWLGIALGAMLTSAAAQTSDRSIIFSTPKSDDTSADVPSLQPQDSRLPVLPGSLQAPDPSLHFQAPNDFPAGPPAPADSPQTQRMRKVLEERRNWTLMTPSEILGGTAADDLLQSPGRDPLGRKKESTQLERYLDRQNPSRSSLTNGWQNERDNSPWQFLKDRDGVNPHAPNRDSTMDTAQRLNEYLSSRRIGDGPANQNNKNFGWDSFTPPAPQKRDKPDLEQLAAMDRFRQMLDPGPAPLAGSSPESKFFPQPKTAPVSDPYLTQPDFIPNPSGGSYSPLTTGIGKPTGLTPLPGIVTQPGIAPATPPAWAPQPAPWLMQGPQPFVMPQRKF